MAEPPVNPELWSLAAMALDYGAEIAADVRETFHPALVTETADGEKQVTQLVLSHRGMQEESHSDDADEHRERPTQDCERPESRAVC